MHKLYATPVVDSRTPLLQCEFLVIDCEMNGLDPRTSQLLSIGWVQIQNLRVINSSGRHMLVHAGQHTGDSSTIHGITDSDLAGASSVASAISKLCSDIPGKVLVFHHARLDIRFLQKAAMQSFRCPMLFPYIDTMELEARRQRHHVAANGLRLPQCRERYGLPAASQHDALADAVATAELLLAQLRHTTRFESDHLAVLPLHYY